MKVALIGFFLAAAAIASESGAVLWRDPGPVESLDLAAGPGGHSKAPQPPFTFEKEDLGGTSPKVLVRDGRGSSWSVKFGPEVKAESFATRFAWAGGYFAEPEYFVREGTIEGIKSLGRAAKFIGNDGTFHEARFEPRDSSEYRFVEGSRWSLDDKTIKGTKELTGLKLTAMLVSNWDMKSENMAIVESKGQRMYALTDWGASMGIAQDISGRSKWDCEGFAKQSQNFVQEVADGYITIDYSGKERQVLNNNIRVADVKWFMDRMSKLTDAQLRAGLQASGATPAETTCFVKALRERLGQLAAAASGSGKETTVIRTRTVTKTRSTTEPPKK